MIDVSAHGPAAVPEWPNAAIAVEAVGLTKRFGGVAALLDGSLRVRKGTIHALVGENGAGKSTLAKIIAGVQRRDEGTLLIGGERRHYGSPRHAIADGVTMMSQELSLLPARSVIENVYLGSEINRGGWLHRRQMQHAFEELCKRVGVRVEPDRRVRDLSMAEQQMVELLRAFARNVQVIILDEPTATLSTPDAEHLLATIRQFRDDGLTIVYISHFLEEVLDTADEVTVLRDGAFVLSGPSSEFDATSLVTAMAGRPLDVSFPARTPPAEDSPHVLQVHGVTSRDRSVRDASFSVRRGEIVCLAGLVGSGRSEVAQCIFGAREYDGDIVIDGERSHWRHPRQAIANGVTMIPESRKTQGLLPNRDVMENMCIASLPGLSRWGWLARRRERAASAHEIKTLDIRPADPRAQAVDLSGGNQQKVLFGRALMPGPKLMIIDEPTRGVDVGAKRAIYDVIAERARSGVAILLVSSETDEVLGLAHRIVVMRDGSVVRELDGLAATKHQLIGAAFTPPARRERP